MGAERQGRDFDFTQRHFEYFRKMSQEYSGIVVADNKFEMFYSRLTKRLRQLELAGFDDYMRYLKSNTEQEFPHFINALTTNLTSFFREEHHFSFLSQKVVAEMLARGQKNLMVWSAGCSVGEETYSIAITLAEAALRQSFNWNILATDIDTAVLEHGRQGVYQLERIKGVPMELKKKWFLRGTGKNEGYARISSELRRHIHFEQLNLIKNFQHARPFDVIFCRNVVIYFDRETKIELMKKFAANLADNGYLILGHSESLHGISNQFQSLGNTVYKKI